MPQLPEQPRRDPGSQLLDAGRPRGRAASAAGRLTLVRYNNEPQFFLADASVFFGLVVDILERLGPYLEPDAVDAETVSRMREVVALVERKTGSRG